MKIDTMGFADLHIHTSYSDGFFSPEHLLPIARRAGLRVIGIADHDCVDGVEIAEKEGKKWGVEVVSGVEISVSTMGFDVHLLGYFIDTRNPELMKYLDFFKNTRTERARKIVRRLNELGLNLEPSTVIGLAGEGSVGRMHVAQALVSEKFCRDIDTAFGQYLRDGGPAFVEKYRISAVEAIDVIHNAGGIALLAHPGFYNDERLMAHLFEVGLDGLEVYNPKHSKIQVRHFQKLIREHNGVESGGSDYHGGKDNSPPLGAFKIPYSIVAKMMEYASSAQGIRKPLNNVSGLR
jgi:predicted metal-dependent phosphoesterase TrpH